MTVVPLKRSTRVDELQRNINAINRQLALTDQNDLAMRIRFYDELDIARMALIAEYRLMIQEIKDGADI